MNAKLNTDYGLRVPERAEIARAFGSLAKAIEITGGDLPTILFYINNRDRIATAPEVPFQPGDFARDLREDAIVEQAAVAFDAQDKPTIIATAEKIGVCAKVARRALVKSGKWPRAVVL